MCVRVWFFFSPFLFSSPVGDMSFKSALANGCGFLLTLNLS